MKNKKRKLNLGSSIMETGMQIGLASGGVVGGFMVGNALVKMIPAKDPTSKMPALISAGVRILAGGGAAIFAKDKFITPIGVGVATSGAISLLRVAVPKLFGGTAEYPANAYLGNNYSGMGIDYSGMAGANYTAQA